MRLYNCPPPPSTRMKPRKSRKKRKHIATAANNNTDVEEEKEDSRANDRKSARLSDVVVAESSELVESVPVPDKHESAEETSPATRSDDLPPVIVAVPNANEEEEEDDDEEEDNDYELPSLGVFSSAASAGDDLSSSQPTDMAGDDMDDDEGELDGGTSALGQLLHDMQDDDEEEEADYDYSPEEADLKKSILVGDNHQAMIPETVLPRTELDRQLVTTSGVDQLLWSPHSEKVKDGAVERFLASFYRLRRHLNHPEEQPGLSAEQLISGGATVLGSGGVVKDEESALRKLLEADYNVEVALQQVCHLMQANGSAAAGGGGGGGYCGPTPVVTWSEEECRHFELGIRLYGKNFPLIQSTKVPSRSVQELVQFYYFWKKTERYDSFAAKQRLEKKRPSSMSNQNPGLTEFMDKFLEEGQQRSISPRQPSVTTTPPPPLSVASGSPVDRSSAGGGGVGGMGGDGSGERAKSPKLMLQGAHVSNQEEGIADGNHSLLIYADSKRHRTSGGPTTPPVVVAVSDNTSCRHPLEVVAAGGKETLSGVEDSSC